MCQAEIPRQGILLPWQLTATLLLSGLCSGDVWLGRDERFVIGCVPEIEVDCACRDAVFDALVATGFALMVQA